MFQSCSFTDAALSDTKFIQDRNSWLTALNTRVLACGVAVVTQNPARSPIEQNDIDNHARKRSKLTTWTAQNGCALIDTYKAFIDDGDLTALTQNDGVSPSTTGSQLWANTVTNAFDL